MFPFHNDGVVMQNYMGIHFYMIRDRRLL